MSSFTHVTNGYFTHKWIIVKHNWSDQVIIFLIAPWLKLWPDLVITFNAKSTSTRFGWCSHQPLVKQVQAPVPLMVFGLNSKFNKNLECSSLEYGQPITTKFCTCHNIYPVVTCKISLWSAEYILNQSTSNFGVISNSIEISLMGLAPRPDQMDVSHTSNILVCPSHLDYVLGSPNSWLKRSTAGGY